MPVGTKSQEFANISKRLAAFGKPQACERSAMSRHISEG
jgi:hypothetical protein